jgi:acyl dehydratase
MVDPSLIGRALPPTHAHVDPERFERFLDALGETNPIYRDGAAAEAAGFSGRPIPPTYLFCLPMLGSETPFAILDVLEVDIARVLHGEQRFVYHAPVFVGDDLTYMPTISDVRDKKGGELTLIDVATRVVNGEGHAVADLVHVIVVLNGGGAA